MPEPDVVAYVRAALPAPPARVLEVGAGDGTLAAALRHAGYDVVAIDPAGSPPVLPVVLQDYDAPPRSFDAAVAIVSLHHVTPLGRSLRHLAGLLRRGARLVVDEVDGWGHDEAAAQWGLSHTGGGKTPGGKIARPRRGLPPPAPLPGGAAA